jgi:hypothetical protein
LGSGNWSGGWRTIVGLGSAVGSIVGGGGFTFGGDFFVQGIEAFGFGAVKVEPPIADEVVLVEDGSVGAEEGVLGKSTLSVGGADVEHLALGLRVSIVT